MGDDDLFHTTLHGTLYHVNRTSNTIAEVAYVVSSASLHLWHRQMGHLHLDAIHKLDQKLMVNGLTITSPKFYDHVCEGCMLGKSHRLPFSNASHTHYEKMKLVIVDLSGPMSVTTWTGKAYTFVTIEMNSQLGIGELLKSKTEAAETLKTVVMRLEQQSGNKLK
jgi:histone deacetylase 1/2